MDQDRFDALARVFGAGLSRRRLARLLGAGMAAAGLRASSVREAAAGTRCIADGENCTIACPSGSPCNACCNGFCAAYGGCTDIGYLDPGSLCHLGTPNQCRSGFTCCPFRPGQRHGQGTCQDVCY
jgi:hypothetical protein